MKKNLKFAAAAILLTSVGGFFGAFLNNSFFVGSNDSAASNSMSAPTRFTSSSASPEIAVDFTKAAAMTVHSVVHITTTYEKRSSYFNPYSGNPFFEYFYGRPEEQNQPQQPESSGSGVIVSNDGYIVTNNHVVENAKKVEVTLNDKRTYTASVIGTDPNSDLALLKIEEKDLPFLAYGNSDDVKVGEWVLAVGNPFNLTSTVTAGIVSAKARDIHILSSNYKIESFIQTDAAVNPGNSGGALVNTDGELIGINAAIASNTGSYTGYSFAIPAMIVKKVVNDLLEFGEVQRGFIGISIRDIDSKLAAEKGIKEIKGVLVDGLTDGGSAKESGIEVGDILTKVGGSAVNSTPELQELVSRYRPGDIVKVTLIRDNVTKEIPVTLKNRRGNTAVVKKEQNEIVSLLGSEFEQVSREDCGKLGINGGARVKRLGSGKLKISGIREGFIITKVDHNPVVSTDDLLSSLQNKKGAVLIEGMYPNGMSAYYAFGL